MWQPSPLSVPVPTQDICCTQIGCASFVATLHFWTIFCCVWSSYWWLFFTRSNCIEIFSLLTPNLLSLSLGLFSSNYSFSDQIKGGTAQSSLVAGLLKSSWFIQATVATVAAGTTPPPLSACPHTLQTRAANDPSVFAITEKAPGPSPSWKWLSTLSHLERWCIRDGLVSIMSFRPLQLWRQHPICLLTVT